jgi:hypothetical protein
MPLSISYDASYVLVSLLNINEFADDLRTRGKPLPDQPMGLTVGDEGETDALVGAPHALLPISTLTLKTHCKLYVRTYVRKEAKCSFPSIGSCHNRLEGSDDRAHASERWGDAPTLGVVGYKLPSPFAVEYCR